MASGRDRDAKVASGRNSGRNNGKWEEQRHKVSNREELWDEVASGRNIGRNNGK